MKLLRKSMRTTGLVAGLLLLGAAVAPFASAEHCFYYFGWSYCFSAQ